MTRAPATIDAYIASFPPAVRAILTRIRRIVRRAAPDGQEVISYRMPAVKRHGILLYFAAFANHIGVFPPIRGDVRLTKALAPYRGGKGNLRFPLDRPIPYDLIERIARLRAMQDAQKGGGRAALRRTSRGAPRKRPAKIPRR